MAQLIARSSSMREVAGSNPVRTKYYFFFFVCLFFVLYLRSCIIYFKENILLEKANCLISAQSLNSGFLFVVRPLKVK